MNKKRILSLLTTGVLCVSLMMSSASAADITIDGSGKGYEGYRLLDLTTSLSCEEEHEHEHDCYNYAYTVNEKYADILAGIVDAEADEVSEEAILSYIEGLKDEAVRDFADAVFAELGDLDADIIAAGKTFAGVDQGYYLIAESERADNKDTISLVMLDTAGRQNLTVQSKEGVPTLTKKIILADGTLADADTVAFGDKVTYRLTATLPQNLSGYDTYKLIFHDDIDAGLSLDEASFTVKVGSVEIEDFELLTATDDCELELQISDLLGIEGLSVSKDSLITVEYTCDVLNTAQLGAAGNANTAFLEFSADPYDEAVTGITLSDRVAVFTFGLSVTKVTEKKGEGEEVEVIELPGADFKLQILVDEEYVDYDAAEKTTNANEDQQIKATVFTFSGLDEGKYRIVETKTPDGYVTCDPIEFEVAAVVSDEADAPELESLATNDTENFTADQVTGMISTKVVNVAGKRMPTTGGQGTIMLYAGGAALVLVAGAAVVLKKRKSEND